MPATDRKLCEALFSLPVEATANRRLEVDILVGIDHRLAAAPLDRNSFRFDPVVIERAMTSRGRIAQSFMKRLRAWYWRRVRRYDPRRYERLFDIDHPRWRAVRMDDEPLRPRQYDLLDAVALNRLWPLPWSVTPGEIACDTDRRSDRYSASRFGAIGPRSPKPDSQPPTPVASRSSVFHSL